MKKQDLTLKLFMAFAVVLSPTLAWGAGSSQDLTATGTISLAGPGDIENVDGQNGRSSNVSFTAVIRGTTGAKITGEGPIIPSATLTTVGRLSNRDIIANALPPSESIRGFRLIVLYEGNLSETDPKVFAFRPANRSVPAAIYPVDASASAGIEVDFGWLNFDGVYAGSGVVSTASPTGYVVLGSGRLSGFTDYYVDLNINDTILPMSGVGSFTQVPRGITGSANLSGVRVPVLD